MTIEQEELLRAKRRERRAVYVGSVVTGLATLAFFVLPDLLPLEAVTQWYFDLTGEVVHGNPFTPIRFCGGVLGGAVAGRLAPEIASGTVTGLKSALYGLGVAYLVVVVFYTLYSVAYGSFPPPVLAILSIPLVYGIPLLGAHAVGGAASGFAAQSLR